MDSAKIMIHVRFAPNGSVTEISERPDAASDQQWFNHLSRNTVNCYESLSGGRGLFRVPTEQLITLKTEYS
ncbi:MAG: hypothetical protein ACYC2R_12890 [Burkholderiales bacterium]|nr:hypothetical protein [Sulfuricellaceae bacterium]